MELIRTDSGFTLRWAGGTLEHSAERPMLDMGRGLGSFGSHQGNFEVSDEILERTPLEWRGYEPSEEGFLLHFGAPGAENPALTLCAEERDGYLRLKAQSAAPRYDRIWLKLPAEEDERVYGGGEQFSYFDMRGRRFPIWTAEQGVGRNKGTMVTFMADSYFGAGGDYYSTYYPQPVFVSSKGYFCSFEDTCYSVMDFTHPRYHEVMLWADGFSLVMGAGGDMKGTVGKLTELFGRKKPLPRWAYEGLWLGVQGGTEAAEDYLRQMRDGGTKVSALWCQDWAGIRRTSFGQRLNWDWIWDEQRYPGLPEKIKEWKESGVRFLAYISPNVVAGGRLFKEASAGGFLVRNAAGEDYLVDFGEFDCGFVDFTNPEAFEWYKGVIKKNIIGLGMAGWMADFSEYLPVDCVLYSGEDAAVMHNRWPVLWARLNCEAVEEAGKSEDIVFFMRAGGAGSQRYATMIWAGDQNVDWSLDDGLASVITSALSCGMSGNAYHTSDIGGYTTLQEIGVSRSRELLLRWAEFCVFTPVMRTHEGNRPEANHQAYTDQDTIKAFARLTQIHEKLAPYCRALMDEAGASGAPLMRPMAFHYSGVPGDRELQFQYLYGPDMLAAPVYLEGKEERKLWLPEDEWVHLWSGERYSGGWVTVKSKLGQPPVFYREGSKFAEIFEEIGRM